MPLSAVKVQDLSKLYYLGHLQERHDTLRDALIGNLHRIGRHAKKQTLNEVDQIWALKDITFEVAPGEVLGIIGRNGAGKSTLLKILSRITEPTSGKAIINGRIGSLLEVGTGFHPELSGRENIYLNGAIIGMTRKEINRKFDEIVTFSELERFLDTPVKRYSSGMYVRLAFAVAAHFEPEILIVDEVISVGDIAFQKKCLGKMGDVSKDGRTVIFVSHNLQAVANLCGSVIWLDQGKLMGKDDPNKQIQEYLKSRHVNNRLSGSNSRTSDYFYVHNLNFHGQDLTDKILPGGELNIEFDAVPLKEITDMSFHVDILGQDHSRILGFDSIDFGIIIEPQKDVSYRLKLKIFKCPLPPGKYQIDVYLKVYSLNLFDYFDLIGEFEVEQTTVYGNRLYDSRAHGAIITEAFMTSVRILNIEKLNKIGIILPTYNGAEYIKKSIQSCVDQSYPHWELIIVDDCSTDNTPEIIEEYSDPRIHVIRHGANLKLPEALNSGFARSQGDYLTWTSDDNMYAPKALETLLIFLQNNPEISLVYSDYQRIDHLGQVLDYYSAPSPEFLSEFNVVGACFLYRRTVYEKIGEYDPSMVLAEDYDYWLRVNNHFKLAALNLPLYYYREHPYTLTNTFGIEKQQLMTEIAREKWIGPSPYFYPSRVSRSISRRYLDFAFDAYKIKNWDLVRKFIVRAIKHDYRWLRNYGVVSLSVRAFIPYLREKMENQKIKSDTKTAN